MQKHVYGGIVWLATTLFVVYSFCLNTAAAVFANTIQSSLHISDTSIALAMGAFILGFAFMQIPAGYLLDKYNARFIVAGGVCVLAIGNFLTSYASNAVLLGLSNFIQGIGASFAFIAIGVLTAQWFKASLFPILFGLAQTISCISAGVIHYFFMRELQTSSWNQLYRMLALLGFILVIISITVIKSPPDYHFQENISFKKSIATVMGQAQILLCALAAATSFGVLLVYAGFWYIKIQEYYSVPNLQAVIISGLIFAGIGVGTPLMGWLSNLAKSRKMIIHISLILGSMVLLLGIYLPHFHLRTLIIIEIISFLIGFFLSGSMLFYTMISEISTNDNRGTALSVTNTAVFLFNTIMMFFPLLFMSTASPLFFTFLWVLPFFIMVSLLLLYFIKDTGNFV